MVEFYDGTPGSGKSLLIARKIDDLLRNTDKYVIANFDIDMRVVSSTSKKNSLEHIESHFQYIKDEHLNPRALFLHCMEHHKVNKVKINGVEQLQIPEGQTLLIIDEAELIFNCRGWNEKGRKDWCKFFSIHRHFGFDVVLISPAREEVDKQILAVVENYWYFMNLKNWNRLGRWVARLFGGSLFTAKRYWHADKSKVCDSAVFRYNKRLGALYNTSALFLDDWLACGLAAGWPIIQKGEGANDDDLLSE